ncbi:MAG: GNAT family N-acetyltransferase [Alphaproteobacteria bacterium]|nr:GNAT family N-acetyltransferase [Alphaproteobacteria bacterium]
MTPETDAARSGSTRVSIVTADSEIAACYPVMRQLRPHLASAAVFLERVLRQQAQGYRLLALWRDYHALACAGFRIQENLVRGQFLYVDDLVTAEGERGRGHARHLLDTLAKTARGEKCVALVLDCGVSNAGAHRFYFRNRFDITAFHFVTPTQGRAG